MLLYTREHEWIQCRGNSLQTSQHKLLLDNIHVYTYAIISQILVALVEGPPYNLHLSNSRSIAKTTTKGITHILTYNAQFV
jgi:hypothetical protein